MLNEWEERQLAEIEGQLGSDKHLGRVLAGPSGVGRARLRVRRIFYPAGYLSCALAYMVASMSGGQRGTVGWALLVLLVAWLALEVHATGLRQLLLQSLQGAATPYTRE